MFIDDLVTPLPRSTGELWSVRGGTRLGRIWKRDLRLAGCRRRYAAPLVTRERQKAHPREEGIQP